MSEIARSPVFRAGVDLFKRVLHVHAVVHPGHVELSKALAPKTFYAWCAQLPPGCAVSSQSHGSQAIGTGLTSRGPAAKQRPCRLDRSTVAAMRSRHR